MLIVVRMAGRRESFFCILLLLFYVISDGGRADVGGGSVANGTRHNLARIPLRWMIRQCFILKTGILFHKDMFKNVGLDPDTLYPYVKRRSPVVHSTPGSLAYNFFAKDYKRTVKPEEPFVNEEEEDMLDALTPIYDQLKMAKSWWILEILPNKQVYQKEDDSWTQTRGYVKLVLLEDNADLGF